MRPKQFFIIISALLAAAVLAGGAGYYLASRNLSGDIQSLSKSLADQEITAEKLEKLQNLSKQYKLLQPLINDMDQALPKEKRQTELALQLQNIATQSGMSLSGITFPPTAALPTATSQTVKQGDVLAIPVSFSLSGSYFQLQNFLQKQEHLNRYTSLTNLTIGKSEKGSLTFTVTLNAYVKP